MKLSNPNECLSIEEVRENIDKIDKKIIKLFAKRSEFVTSIVKFKTDAESVVAKDRQKVVLDQIGDWAELKGLNRDLYKTVYKMIIDKNVDHELNLLHKLDQEKK